MGFLINDREDGKFRRMIKTAFLPMNGHYMYNLWKIQEYEKNMFSKSYGIDGVSRVFEKFAEW